MSSDLHRDDAEASELTPGRHRDARAPVSRPSSFDIELCHAGSLPSGRTLGERMTVTPQSRHDTVGDLATALGTAIDDEIVLDGLALRRDALLADVGCLHGSRLAIGRSSTSPPIPHAAADGATAVLEMSIDSGPDCATTVALGAGRHVIGRSSDAHIRVADARLGLHHAVIDVDATSVTVTQLSGQAPIRVDGRPVTGTHTATAPVRLTIGTSDVRFAAIGSVEQRLADGNVVPAPHDPWRRIVQRSPDRPIAPVEDPIAPPAAADVHRVPPATALIGAAVGVLGAGVIALLLGQMLFALFAVFGAVASAATWLVGATSAWRRNRRSRGLVADDRQRFLDELAAARRVARRRHVLTHPHLGQSMATAAALAGPLPLRSDVWQQRLGDAGGRTGSSDAEDAGTTFHPVIGTGTCRWTPTLAGEITADSAAELECAATIDDVPIPVALARGEVTAISGDPADRSAMLRSMLCQMAVRHGPADWQLVVVSSSPERWAWSGWLPHAATTTGTVLLADASDSDDVARVLALADGSTPRPTLLVVDEPSLFAVRTGPLRRFVDRVHPATVTMIDVGAPTPAVCTAVIEIGSTGAVMTTRLDGGGGDIAGSASSIRMCGLSVERAAAIARALAALIDPEMLALSEVRLDRTVALGDLDDVVLLAGGDDSGRRTAVSTVQRRWLGGGADPAPKVALGQSADGVVEVDLVADGPHALIAGTTGSGKSELLRSLVVGLSLRLSPEHLTFVLVDYKGGSTFDRCAELPHTVGMVTDLDAGLAERALVSLDAELHRRERLLRDVGAVDLADYRLHPDALVLPRLVVVIDEFAALAKELPEFLAALVGIAQRGRSLGVHLILATQRPAGVVSDDIRANTNLRLALRLNDGTDALDVVGDTRPSAFARDVPGRAALRLGPEELVVFQTARCSGAGRSSANAMRVASTSSQDDRRRVESPDTDASTELDVAVSVIAAAFQQLEIDAPHRPWIDALPDRLSSTAVDLVANAAVHDGVGLLDDPAAQCRRMLRWDRALGNLALVGSLGSGTTTAMRSVIASRCRGRPVDLEHWYVIDARGEASLDELNRLDHVGAVVRVQEQERVHRVLARLVDEIDRRSGAALPEQSISLAIDGLSPLRAALSTVEHAATLALLERLLTDGPPVGIAACWTDDPASAIRSAAASETWVFRCDDPALGRSLGATAGGSKMPGHLTVVSCGLHGVVAVDSGMLPPHSETFGEQGPQITSAVPMVQVLPARLTHDLLPAPAACRSDGRNLTFDVGIRYDDLQMARLSVPSGDHLLIGGAAATGKTTALGHIVRTWQAAHPQGCVVEVDRRRPLTAEAVASIASRPALIAVDDAERVDDADGVLATLVAAAARDVLIVAAGRLDALRSAYGHWTRDVARSRCGLILTASGDVEGDLLGATLPRRSPVAARPGLAWLIDGGGHRLVQLAVSDGAA